MVKQFLRYMILTMYLLVSNQQVLAQCPSGLELRKKLVTIEKDTTRQPADKLQQLHQLHQLFLACHKNKDSIYARILHRLGALYSYTGEMEKAISFTRRAVAVNSSGNPGTDRSYLVNSYINLGTFYSQLYLTEDAHRSWDNCISIGRRFPAKYNLSLLASEEKAAAYFQTGDYQKVRETAEDGILLAKKLRNVPAEAALLALKAQAQCLLNDTGEAERNIKKAIDIQGRNSSQPERLATCYSIYAQVLSRKGAMKTAIQYYRKALALNQESGKWEQCSRNLLDLGYLYDYLLGDAENALACYKQGLSMLGKANDDYQRVGIFINMGYTYWRQKHYIQALQSYQQALNALPINFTDTNVNSNPTEKMLKLVANDYYVATIFSNKAEVFLDLYKKEKNQDHLAAALENYLLADKLVDQMRRKQYGEQSKLFWRGQVKHIYKKAIEACYLARNSELAFFFMEKSRAVLLNAKLNELGAFAKLPPSELAKDQHYRMKVLTAQQKLAAFSSQTPESEKYQAGLLQAKNDFEKYIKTLEKKYPLYFQYKYAADVPSLKALQKYLARNNTSFVHYFLDDSLTFILSITPGDTRLVKVPKENFHQEQLSRFIGLCSDKQTLNNHYNAFASLSNKLYHSLFQPLQLPPGKIIICADNFLIPFEALCMDSRGKQYLIDDYVFSYVYSAGYLLKELTAVAAKGDFVGFAPVNFQPYLQVVDLKQAAVSLKEAANHYSSTKLFTNDQATKSNFIRHISDYSIVNVFSHARADTTGSEPLLLMQDSAIYLSDLQLPHKLATRLVVLSACQTNVGKNATGEGIYSLARGFAAAGIPSVAATLWKADEQATYEISKSFHQYLAQGMHKDEALQQAKLYFIKNTSKEKSLPYFWANMIITGNSEPVTFMENQNKWWWIGSSLILSMILAVIIFSGRKRLRR
jgi:CHAT domain-containing protein/tetratricopeptide (TPR) repeat protein